MIESLDRLALIGAIVAELAAGKGAGLAFRISEADYRLNIPRTFAALSALSFYLLGRRHDSAAGPER